MMELLGLAALLLVLFHIARWVCADDDQTPPEKPYQDRHDDR
ncbi:MAG: hypothetical protein QM813_09395 [Verrucomicrobiota bacterium]